MTEEIMLVPTDTYLKAGVHIGTKFKTKDMRPFIYKIRNDGLCILNLQKIDQRIKIAANFLSQYNPEDIIIVSRRENGWMAANKFGDLVGCKVFVGRYPPGIMTNINLKTFVEAKVIVVTDPWPDRNAINDAVKAGIPIIALCDTNNFINSIDYVVPINNKGKKSLGIFFWILAREYMRNRGLLDKAVELDTPLEEFTGE